jgi:cobalamin biosynthesis Mg chelatase CobN
MAKSLDDDQKVMDVNRPGNGKIIPTSRPVITTGSQIEVQKEGAPEVAAPEAIKGSPSTSKKVIQPLDPAIDNQDKPAEPTSQSQEKDTEASHTPDEEEDKDKDEKPNYSSSEEASVDAVVGSIESKKEATKKAEEQAKKDAALQELIDSKKYVVPIGHGTKSVSHASKKKSNDGALIVLLILIIVLVVVYFVIDAGFVEAPIELPVDLIK